MIPVRGPSAKSACRRSPKEYTWALQLEINRQNRNQHVVDDQYPNRRV